MTSLQRISSPIVGARYHPGAQEALALLPEDSTVWLVREPRNPHDRNAVAIYVNRTRRQHLGYVIAEVAKYLAPILDYRLIDEIEARYVSIKGKPHISLVIERR